LKYIHVLTWYPPELVSGRLTVFQIFLRPVSIYDILY